VTHAERKGGGGDACDAGGEDGPTQSGAHRSCRVSGELQRLSDRQLGEQLVRLRREPDDTGQAHARGVALRRGQTAIPQGALQLARQRSLGDGAQQRGLAVARWAQDCAVGQGGLWCGTGGRCRGKLGLRRRREARRVGPISSIGREARDGRARHAFPPPLPPPPLPHPTLSPSVSEPAGRVPVTLSSALNSLPGAPPLALLPRSVRDRPE
jgi:hypothetical protein